MGTNVDAIRRMRSHETEILLAGQWSRGLRFTPSQCVQASRQYNSRSGLFAGRACLAVCRSSRHSQRIMGIPIKPRSTQPTPPPPTHPLNIASGLVLIYLIATLFQHLQRQRLVAGRCLRASSLNLKRSQTRTCGKSSQHEAENAPRHGAEGGMMDHAHHPPLPNSQLQETFVHSQPMASTERDRGHLHGILSTTDGPKHHLGLNGNRLKCSRVFLHTVRRCSTPRSVVSIAPRSCIVGPAW